MLQRRWGQLRPSIRPQPRKPCKLLSRPCLMGDGRTTVSMDPVSLQRLASQTLTPLHFLVVHMWPEHSPKMASTGELWDWSQEVGPPVRSATCWRRSSVGLSPHRDGTRAPEVVHRGVWHALRRKFSPLTSPSSI